jgi:hypothetical protein
VTSRRRVASRVAIVLGVGGAGACINTADPTLYSFRYQVGAFGCGTTCAAPDSAAPIESAALGDTVWVLNALSLVAALDSFTVEFATLRPDCEQNVVVLAGTTIVRTLPTPSCPDSTYQQGFQLAGINYPQTVIVSTRWVVDSQLAPGLYGLKGRVLVRPRLEPVYTVRVQ